MPSARSNLASCPLYDSTYSLFRLSPLNLHDEGRFTQASLREHSRRLQDALKGDGVRGMRLDIDQDVGLSRAGALQSCRWTWLGGSNDADDNDPSTASIDGLGVCQGLRVDLKYERTSYRALIVQLKIEAENGLQNELHLPLLLVRMPTILRQVFFDYISTRFDTRAEPLLLPNLDLASLLEEYLAAAGSAGPDAIEDVVKQVQLSIAFRGPNIRSMDITISQEDVPAFIARGKTATDSSANPQTPFLSSLSEYLAQHMAMDINHKDISLSRVACAAFALGGEGRAKIFSPSSAAPAADATSGLIKALLKHATVQQLDKS